MNGGLIVAIVAFFAISFYISRMANNIVSRLIFLSAGIYFIKEFFTSGNYGSLSAGIGMIIPHVLPVLYTFKEVFDDLRYATVNSYYFFITIYYKLLKLFRLIINLIKMPFTYRAKKEYERRKREYEEQKAKEEAQRKANEERAYYKRKEQYEKEQQQKAHEQAKRDRKTQREQQEQQRRYEKQKAKEEANRSAGLRDEYHSGIPSELKQFYSLDPFIVLGINKDDKCKTIKKAYRELAKQYHPDRQGNEYTEVFQFINGAYEDVNKRNGC
jgi:curved DNA-binding protein CbpA